MKKEKLTGEFPLQNGIKISAHKNNPPPAYLLSDKELLAMVKSCKNRKELINKLGGDKNDAINRKTYLSPLRKRLNMTPEQLTAAFAKADNKKI